MEKIFIYFIFYFCLTPDWLRQELQIVCLNLQWKIWLVHFDEGSSIPFQFCLPSADAIYGFFTRWIHELKSKDLGNVQVSHFSLLTAVARYCESSEKVMRWMLSLAYCRDCNESLCKVLQVSMWTVPVSVPTARYNPAQRETTKCYFASRNAM